MEGNQYWEHLLSFLLGGSDHKLGYSHFQTMKEDCEEEILLKYLTKSILYYFYLGLT